MYLLLLLGNLCLSDALTISEIDPCYSYTLLTEPWRNTGFSSTVGILNAISDNALNGTWYRFTGIAGDVMPQSCLEVRDGGLNCVMYLGFSHPVVVGMTKSGTSYCCWKGYCRYRQFLSVSVKACLGYYVYKLPPVPAGVSFGVEHSICLLSSCGPYAQCLGYGTCYCVPGFQFPHYYPTSPDSYDCEDIDECNQTVGLCGANAGCVNTVGSYNCYCNPGYISSTELVWESGVTRCTQLDDELSSLSTTTSSPEAHPLESILEEMNLYRNVVLSEATVASTMDTVMMIANMPNNSHHSDNMETGNTLLEIFEMLAYGFATQTLTYYAKNVTTPTYEIDVRAVGPSYYMNLNTTSLLSVKGSVMEVNLSAIAQQNNGSAAVVLMSVDGLEKFLSANDSGVLYSPIATAMLPGINSTSLSDPVHFTMHHNQTSYQEGEQMTCVYWKRNQWSTDGCTVSVSSENYTICSCSHLSSFAVLLQVREVKEQNDSLLEWVNKVCVCIGLFFLGLAVLTFLFCSWNPKVNNTARLHLCICLFVAQLLFLVGLSRTENKLVCAVIAGLLQFFFLSSFVWMFLETLQLFLLVRSLTKVKVIKREGLKAQYLLLIGYGTPLVVVGVSAALVPFGYGSPQQCWLSREKGFIWSFMGPVCTILGTNCLLFFLILWSLRTTLSNMKKGMSQASDTRMVMFKILAQFVILGCAWVLGLYQESTILKYLFIILNSQQGTFIFIVHCLFNKEIRQEYIRWISHLCKVEIAFQSQQPSVCEDSFNDSMSVPKSDSNVEEKEDATKENASTDTKN